MKTAEEQKTGKKKTLSNIVNWILGLLIVFLLGCQVQIIRSKSSNYNVPSLFGYSFMTVLTDSMVNTSNPSESLDVGTGVVMQKVSADSIVVGDVITFYSVSLTQAAGGQQMVVSHRVMEIGKDTDGSYIFYTRGDNLNAETCPNHVCADTYRDTVPEKYYLGKIVYHSNTLGGFLSLAQSMWFIPVCCLLPLLLIVISSLVDLLKAIHSEQSDIDRQVLLGANKAGIDFNDEKAMYLFSEKERYKIELRETMEKQKEEEKKKLMKEMKKQTKKSKMEEGA